jgi:hypothetical protein
MLQTICATISTENLLVFLNVCEARQILTENSEVEAIWLNSRQRDDDSINKGFVRELSILHFHKQSTQNSNLPANQTCKTN